MLTVWTSTPIHFELDLVHFDDGCVLLQSREQLLTILIVELFEIDGPLMLISFELFHDVVNHSLLFIAQFFPFPEGFEVINALFTTFI